MTLLESIVAFVVLALVGIACLDLSRGAVQLQRSSAEWTAAVRIGDAALASALLGDAPSPDATVSRRSWRNDRAIEVVEVSVPLQHGGTYRLQRLVRRTPGRTRVASVVATPFPGAERSP